MRSLRKNMKSRRRRYDGNALDKMTSAAKSVGSAAGSSVIKGKIYAAQTSLNIARDNLTKHKNELADAEKVDLELLKKQMEEKKENINKENQINNTKLSNFNNGKKEYDTEVSELKKKYDTDVSNIKKKYDIILSDLKTQKEGSDTKLSNLKKEEKELNKKINDVETKLKTLPGIIIKDNESVNKNDKNIKNMEA